jgi:hypothetical protein
MAARAKTSAKAKPKAPAAKAQAPVRPPQPLGLAQPVPEVRSALESPGLPLDPDLRSDMESRFGHDFSQVRVHTSGPAAAAAKALQSLAFTHGQDIVFAAGQYQPRTPAGARLLAHELAHTLQQRGAARGTQGFSEVSKPDAPLEREAEAAAARVEAGGTVAPASLSVGAAGARGLISRRVDPAAAASSEAVALDSTRIIETLVRVILLSLQVDPTDSSGRVRRQLEPLPPAVREAVMAQLRTRVAPARLEALLATPEAPAEEGKAPGEPVQAGATEAERAAGTAARSEEAARDRAEGTAVEAGAAPGGERAGTVEQGAPAAAQRGEAPAEEEARAREERQAASGGRERQVATAGTPPAEGAARESQQAEAEGTPPEEAPPLQMEQVEGSAAQAAEQGGAQAEVAGPGGPAGGVPAAAQAGGAAPAPGASAEPAEGAAPAGGEAPVTDEGASPGGAEAAAPQSAEGSAAPEPPSQEEAAAPDAGAPEPEEVAAAEEESATAQVLPEPEQETLPTGSPPEVQPGPTPEQLGTGGSSAPAVESGAGTGAEAAEPDAAGTAREAQPEAAVALTEEAAPAAGATLEEAEAGPVAAGAEPVGAESEGAVEEATTPGLEAPGPEAGAESLDAGGTAGAGELAGDMGEGGGEMPAPSGGGGGGGSAVPEPPAPSAPDVSQSDPVSAMGAVGNLPAVQLQQALGGVSASASRTVQDQRQELAANPPQMQRPSGAPEDGAESEAAAPPSSEAAARVERAPEGAAVPVPSPAPLPQAPVLPTSAVATPSVSGASEISANDAQQVMSAVRSLPTQDPALNVTVGPAPVVALEGNADPTRMREQRERLNQGVTEAQAQGQRDVAQPMGEAAVLPDVPEEMLQARPAQGGGGAGGGGAQAGVAAAGPGGAAGGGAGGGADDVALSVIAEQERGDEIRASVGEARSELGNRVQEHGEQVAEARASSQEEIDTLVEQNAGEQTAERSRVRRDVQARRGEWNREQNEAVSHAREGADAVGQQGARDLERERGRAESEAAGHVRQGNTEVDAARQDAERNAARQRREAEGESGSILGWIGSRVRAFFDRVRRAIQEGFERARRLVRDAIQRARQLAMEAIERGRRALVGIIRWAGDRLIEIGDTLLAAFPRLRDRYRRFIEERVAQAQAAVNRLAEALREGVQRALDLLGAALDAALGLLERGLLAAVDAVNQVVQGALNAARAVAQALGAFVQLIRDIAANPGQWLRNLGASVVDGIRNHFVGAMRQAIRQWFNETVESVLGLGSAIINLLRRGGISFQQIASMAWQALRSVIPMLLIQLLIQRLVAMIVPAAGAVLAIIEGLQAAWGTVSRIIQAFQQFFAFLRAVKDGNAGPQFAQALASAAIVVIQFVAFFLLRRLVRPAARVGARLRAMAQRIGRMLQRVARTVARGARAAGRGIMRGVRAVGRRVMRGVRAVGRRLGRTRLGRLFRRGWQGMRRRLQQARERIRQWRQRRRQRREQAARERIERAQRELPPLIQRLLAANPSVIRLRAQLLYYRLRYRLRELTVRENGARVQIHGRVNPVLTLPGGWKFEVHDILRVLDEIAEEMIDAAVREQELAGGPPATQQGVPVDLTGTREPGAGVITARPSTSFLVGGTQGTAETPGVPIGYRVERNPRAPWWQRVAGLNAPAGGPEARYRPELATSLEGQPVGTWMTALLRRQPVPASATPHVDSLGTLYGLWFGWEPSHPRQTAGHRRDLVYSLMATELMNPRGGQRALTVGEAIDLHPASFGGAQAATRHVTSRLAGEETSLPRDARRRRDREQRLRRERAILRRWFRLHAPEFPVMDERPTLDDVRRFIRERLRSFVQGEP